MNIRTIIVLGAVCVSFVAFGGNHVNVPYDHVEKVLQGPVTQNFIKAQIDELGNGLEDAVNHLDQEIHELDLKLIDLSAKIDKSGKK